MELKIERKKPKTLYNEKSANIFYQTNLHLRRRIEMSKLATPKKKRKAQAELAQGDTYYTASR